MGIDGPDVATEIIESNDVVPALLAATGPGRVLCLETRAHGPLAAAILGSTASALLRATTQPVLLVGPAADPELPLDLMEVAVDQADVVESLVAVAGAWACALHLRLRLVHAEAVPDRHSRWDEAERDLVAMAHRTGNEFGVDAEAQILTGREAPEALVEDTDPACAIERSSSLRAVCSS